MFNSDKFRQGEALAMTVGYGLSQKEKHKIPGVTTTRDQQEKGKFYIVNVSPEGRENQDPMLQSLKAGPVDLYLH